MVQQYPLMDEIADKIIAKYQHSVEEKKMIQLLKGDPEMRQAFINNIALPITNKMFDCGLIP